MRSKANFWLALFLLAIAPAFAQTPAPPPDAGSIHGHVQDPANAPLANMQVQLTVDGKTPKYTFTTDENGDYKGSGIAPGTYAVNLIQPPSKAVDQMLNVKIVKDTDTLTDFDMSRPEYVNSLPPETRKQIADIKAKNAEAIKENQSVNKLNDMLKEARADNAQKKFDDSANIMQQAVAIKADVPILWLELGISQTGQKKYSDAATSLQKALDLNAASKKPSPDVEAAANNELGEADAGQGKLPESSAAYDAAAKALPANAAAYYTNQAIVMSRIGNTDAAVAAADKAIAADPTKPVPYYLKGQALVGKATVDPKTNQVVAPPGCVEAYQKYLELAPNGPFAPEVQQVLAGIGAKVSTTYKAPKGSK
jgi:tetratricopeptide (TPR) repeat protein